MIKYSEVEKLIKNEDMVIISSYNSAYSSNKLLNLKYDDFINKRKIEINHIDNKNTGDDYYNINVYENNKNIILVPVIKPYKFNYNPFTISKILSYQNVYPEVYTKNQKDIIISKKCGGKELELEFDKNNSIINFESDRIEVLLNNNESKLLESYQILKNGFFCNNQKEHKQETHKLDNNSLIVYKNFKYNSTGELYLDYCPNKIIQLNDNNEEENKYKIKYYNNGMVKSIKDEANNQLCISNCTNESGFSFYNLLYDPFNIWNNSRNNLYSLWSLSYFIKTKYNKLIFNLDTYIVRLSNVSKILEFITKKT